MAFDQRRKRPLASRPEDARQQRLVAVAEIFDILDVELMRLGLEQRGGHGEPREEG